MNQPKLNPSEADLIASIEEAAKYKKAIFHKEEDRTVWRSRNEVLNFIGLKKTTGTKYIHKAVEEGRLEKKKFKVVVGNSSQMVPFYKVVEDDEITRPY